MDSDKGQEAVSAATIDRLADVLRPLVAEVGRAHDLVLGDSHEALIAGYRDLMQTLVTFARQVRLGGPAHGGSAVEVAIDEIDRRILEALDRGVLLTRIARDVDLSRSTVNRHLRRLRERTGAFTPFQLGRAAESLGWLNDAGGEHLQREDGLASEHP